MEDDARFRSQTNNSSDLVLQPNSFGRVFFTGWYKTLVSVANVHKSRFVIRDFTRAETLAEKKNPSPESRLLT